MRILVVATKSPWPPRDGGRLALWLTMQGLAEAGHELALVAPAEAENEAQAVANLNALRTVCDARLVAAGRRSWPASLARSLWQDQAVTMARHRLVALGDAIAEMIERWRPQIVHAEQLQAMANVDFARTRGIPIALRMQNVESSLWRQVANARWQARPMLLEARRLCRDEVRALNSVARVIALTERDADDLRQRVALPNRARINALAPPFPSRLPAAAPLEGAPAVVIAGSGGWWPNQQGLDWFLDRVAPLLSTTSAGTRIHVFGGEVGRRSGVICHAAPVDAIDAFPEGAVAAIPLLIGSGIRMRILEAWARGLPVVATTVAAAGLAVVSGRQLLIADTPDEFAQAILRLGEDAPLRAHLIENGHAYLAQHHDPAAVTQALVAEYRVAQSQL